MEASAEAEVLEKIPDEDVQRALEALPEKFRMAVLLADVEGFSYKEIAEIIGHPDRDRDVAAASGKESPAEAVVGNGAGAWTCQGLTASTCCVRSSSTSTGTRER